MNKLLTTITLLCFSVAANADVWFCTSNSRAILRYASGVPDIIENESETIILDTNEGFRIDGRMDDYTGECVESNSIITCRSSQMLDSPEDRNRPADFSFYLNVNSLKFVQWSVSLDEEMIGVGLHGTCIKA